MPHLKLSKSQYAELVRDIEDTLKTLVGRSQRQFGAARHCTVEIVFGMTPTLP
jgi:hypothetical protein